MKCPRLCWNAVSLFLGAGKPVGLGFVLRTLAEELGDAGPKHLILCRPHSSLALNLPQHQDLSF